MDCGFGSMLVILQCAKNESFYSFKKIALGWGSFQGPVCITAKCVRPIEFLTQCSFKLAQVTHSISLSCVGAPVVTYYTKVFSGNAAKTSLFDDLGWWLYLRHSVCFLFTEPGLCMNNRLFFSVHTQNGKLVDREVIFSEFDKKCMWLES